jgi:hypothetical protein
MTVACDDMNSIIQDDLDKGEAIYPGSPDYYNGWNDVRPGIRKVWLFWVLNSDTRVDKTVISYVFNGETTTVEKTAPEIQNDYQSYRIDSLLIDNLAEGYYSFSAYTVDKEGHRSIASNLYYQYSEMVMIYGDTYLNTLSPRSISQTEMLAGGNLKIIWAPDTTDVLYSLVEHTDYRGSSIGKTTVDTVLNTTTESLLTGFTRFQNIKVTSHRRIGIDAASVEYIHAAPVVERALLSTAPNTFTELTADVARNVQELAYPIGIQKWTLQDLYYFPNLRTLDLTPGTTELPTLSYYRVYTDKQAEGGGEAVDTTKYADTICGGTWSNVVSGFMPKSDIDIIDSLLASGQLTKVKYTRNSYPGLDAVLSKYPGIEWNPVEPLEKGVMIPYDMLVDYGVVDRNRGVNLVRDIIRRGEVNLTYAESGSNVPAAIRDKFPDGDLNNAYRVTVARRPGDNASVQNVIAFAVPTGDLQLGLGRLKFDCYIESQNYDWLTSGGVSRYEVWKKVKVWCERFLPGDIDVDNSPYRAADFPTNVNGNDNPYRADSHEFFLSSNNPGFDIAFGDWTSCEWDLISRAPGHYRIVRIQFGADGAPWGLPEGRSLTYYIANLRFEN